jgi:hypothetical protein
MKRITLQVQNALLAKVLMLYYLIKPEIRNVLKIVACKILVYNNEPCILLLKHLFSCSKDYRRNREFKTVFLLAEIIQGVCKCFI